MYKRINISFAEQSFIWDNSVAAVYVVIIGFRQLTEEGANLLASGDINSDSVEKIVSHINQYLLNLRPPLSLRLV